MIGEILLSLLAVAIAYLLGSIPSAYLIGRWFKGIDIREIGDGRLGATAAYRRVGFGGGIIVFIMDAGKGAAAVLIAQMIMGLPLAVVLIAGLAAVVGHNWSMFLHFKGGKGALTTYGVLVSLMFWQFFAALAIAAIATIITKKTGFSTGVLFCFLALLNLVSGSPVLLIIFPIIISVPMVLKHISMPKAGDTVRASIKRLGSKEG